MEKNMTDKDRNLEITQYVDATLALHGLELNEARRAETEKQFLLLASMSRIIATEPIPDEIEPAGIFRL
ncbi:MAG TPA: DUF4089 domain-containing protein [Burkholderiales bacterium]|nr:DUF4089 domain-containing protein [Burkholderiales bacterium]